MEVLALQNCALVQYLGKLFTTAFSLYHHVKVNNKRKNKSIWYFNFAEVMTTNNIKGKQNFHLHLKKQQL